MYPYHNRRKPANEENHLVEGKAITHPQPNPHLDHPQPDPHHDHPQPNPRRDHPQPDPHNKHPQPNPRRDHPQPNPHHNHPQPGMKPPTAPPVRIPPRNNLPGIELYTITNCLYNATYIWLKNGREFWFYPVYAGRTTISGFRWSGGGWVYYGFSVYSIEAFACNS